MARNRTISPDFWTWEAVIDCTPMTRLLFLGLWNFANDHGVQPLRPRTIRPEVFPGAEIMANHSNPSPDDGQGPRTALSDERPARPTPATKSMANHSNPFPDDGHGPRTALADEGPARPTPATESHSNPSPEDGQGPRTALADEGPPRPTPATKTMANHSKP